MISVPTSEYNSIITSVADGTQPTDPWGTSVTPGASNTFGSYATVLSGASLVSDAYAIEIIIANAATSGADRGMLVTIGFDPAGGTSFSGLGGVAGNEISNLLCSGAYNWFSSNIPGGGHRFWFPLFIKAGTSIGAKAQTNHATAGSVRVSAKLWCQPKRPDAVRAGAFVRTFGADTATTNGTGITQGTASEGSWTEIGTAADSLWYLETGLGARTATAANALSHSDVGIGDASNKRVVIQDLFGLTNTGEALYKIGTSGAHVDVASGDKLYGRSQASAVQTGFSMALYGVGG